MARAKADTQSPLIHDLAGDIKMGRDKRVTHDMADMLLTGQRVIPVAAQKLGFQFNYPTLPEALQACMPL